MSYARTLASGHGLVWYPGAPRVEGFTNPLWTVLMAGYHGVGFRGSSAALAISLTGIVILAASCLVAAGIVRLLGARSAAAPVLTVIAVGFCYPLVYWTLRGMEVGLVTLLTLLSVLFALLATRATRHRIRSRHLLLLGVMLSLGMLTRMDFAVIAVVIGSWMAWAAPKRQRARCVGTVAVVTVTVLVALTAFRLWYYGSALPNTYVLKMTGVDLVTRLDRGFATSVAAFLVAFAASLILVVVAIRKHKFTDLHGPVLLLAISAGTLAYSTYVGGDAWEWMRYANRYLVPGLVVLFVAAIAAADRLLVHRRLDTDARDDRVPVALVGVALFVALVGPLAADGIGWSGGDAGILGARGVDASLQISAFLLLVGLLAVRLTKDRPHGSAVQLTVVVLLLLVGANVRADYLWATENGIHVKDDQAQVEYGTLLHRVTTERARIAVTWAGAPMYFADRPGVDLLGKSDAVIARSTPRADFKPGHNKWNYQYSIGELRPDVIAELWNPSTGDIASLKRWGYVPVRLRPELGGPRLVGRVFLALKRSPNIRWDELQIRPWPESP